MLMLSSACDEALPLPVVAMESLVSSSIGGALAVKLVTGVPSFVLVDNTESQVLESSSRAVAPLVVRFSSLAAASVESVLLSPSPCRIQHRLNRGKAAYFSSMKSSICKPIHDYEQDAEGIQNISGSNIE